MTAQSAIPLKWYVPFANGDSSRVELPVTTSDPTRASQTLGFPPLTMQPPESGGVPPQGEDFNGGMNQVARVAWWTLNGGGWPYDATFATNSNINGYPNGALIQSADFRGYWLNTSDNNQINPDTIGTNWVPAFQYGTTAITGLTNANVTLTPAQAAKGAVTLAGTLTGNIQVIVPAWLKNWDVTNNTTGAFAITFKTPSGSGIVIPQNGSLTVVTGDGTNIVQSPRNIAAPTSSVHAAQFAQTTGRLLRTTVYQRISGTQNITTIVNGVATGPTTTGATTFTPLAAMIWCEIEGQGGGGAGGGAAGATGSNISLGAPGGPGSYARVQFTAAQIGASQTVTVGAGGIGVAGATGNAGGNTTVGAILTAPGGTAGTAFNNNAAPNVNGNGVGATAASSSGATIYQSQGIPGQISIAISSGVGYGGAGGASLFGGGAPSASINTNGNNASNLGAGGSGTCVNISGGTATGGSGLAGLVVIREYA